MKIWIPPPINAPIYNNCKIIRYISIRCAYFSYLCTMEENKLIVYPGDINETVTTADGKVINQIEIWSYCIYFADNIQLMIGDNIYDGMPLGVFGDKIEKNQKEHLKILFKFVQDKRIYDCIDVFNKNISLPDVDQTLINYVFYPKIGIMPSKYITFNFYDEQDIRFYHSKLRTNVDISELINSLDNTTIIHFLLCYPKIWDFESKYKSSMSKCEERKDCSCSKFHDLWYSYANKTLYYNDIYKFYKKN